jgi:AAA domain-containing protein/bifunctional DNA primase/polymerase-like protein
MTPALAPAATATPAAAPARVPSFVEGLITASLLGESGAAMLDVALALRNAGWRVFPCGQSKKPLVGGGFKARSVDPEQIKQWWLTNPDALPAIVPGDGDLAALDVDSTAAAAAVDGAGYLDEKGGFVVLTGGTSAPFRYRDRLWEPMHVYVRAPEQPKLLGVVARFRSGYVIAPGARRGERVYRVASSNEPRVWTSDTETSADVQTPPVSRSPQEAPNIERVRQAVACIPNDEKTSREGYVGMAHMIRGAVGEAGRDIFLVWAGRWTGGTVDPAEDERVWDTLPPSRLGWNELWHVAARHGFDATPEIAADAQNTFAVVPGATPPSPPSSLRARLEAIRATLASIPDPLEREIARAEQLARLSSTSRVNVAKLSDLLAAFDAPHRTIHATSIRPGTDLRNAIGTAPPDTLVPGYLYVQAQHVLFGAPAAYKTFLALDWALHIASGVPWLNRIPVAPRGVVFFAGEAAPRLRLRVAAWCAKRGVSVEQATLLPFALVDIVPTLGTGDDGLQDALKRIREATGRPELLVFDNMTRMAAQSNLSTVDPAEFGRIFAALDALARSTGASTLTICHSPMSDPSKPQGSYPIMANPDVVLQAVRGAGQTTKISSIKTRDTAAAEALQLTLEVVDVRDWLRASYAAEGLPAPPTLKAAESEGGRHQFTSLVVAGGISTAAAAAAEAETAEIAKWGDDREWIRQHIAAHPDGLSKREIRERAGGNYRRLDAILGELMHTGAITMTPERGRHVYRAALGAARVESEAARTEPKIGT